jgi:hypothetical protein
MKSIFAIALLIFTAIINVSSASQLEFRCNIVPVIKCSRSLKYLGKNEGFTVSYKVEPDQGFIDSRKKCYEIFGFYSTNTI